MEMSFQSNMLSRSSYWLLLALLLNVIGGVVVLGVEVNNNSSTDELDLTNVSEVEFSSYFSDSSGIEYSQRLAIAKALIECHRSDLISVYLRKTTKSGEDLLMLAMELSTNIEAKRRAIVAIMRTHWSLEDPPPMKGSRHVPSMGIRDNVAIPLIRELLPGLLDQLSGDEINELFVSREWRTEIAGLLERKLNGETVVYDPLVPDSMEVIGVPESQGSTQPSSQNTQTKKNGLTTNTTNDERNELNWRAIGLMALLCLGLIGIAAMRFWKKPRV